MPGLGKRAQRRPIARNEQARNHKSIALMFPARYGLRETECAIVFQNCATRGKRFADTGRQ